MRKNLILFFGIFVLMSSCTVTSMPAFYDKYSKQGTLVSVPAIAVKALGKLSNNQEFTNYLKSSKIFVMTEVSDRKMNRVMRDLKSSVQGERYQQPIHLKKGSKTIEVALQENQNRVKGMILGISGFNTVLVIQSKVDIPKETIHNALNEINDDFIDDLMDLLVN
ncbi:MULTISPECIES: DUF4252 domain-containing protein [Weeksella]|nr:MULTISPECIES: DUF4252 domain-containing protein [Weeksella]MDK7676163.1 DUF4252 domain-containing protein [Weeksella virosa]